MSIILSLVSQCCDPGIFVCYDFPCVYIDFLPTVLVAECTAHVESRDDGWVLLFSTLAFRDECIPSVPSCKLECLLEYVPLLVKGFLILVESGGQVDPFLYTSPSRASFYFSISLFPYS